MCFGGGGRQEVAQPNINVMPQAPVVKMPEAPKQLTQEYKPLQPLDYQPGIQQAGSSRRRQSQADGRATMAGRRGLTIGLNASQSAPPAGGINL